MLEWNHLLERAVIVNPGNLWGFGESASVVNNTRVDRLEL